VDRLFRFFDFGIVWSYLDWFIEGIIVTLSLSIACFILSLPVGLVVALARRFGGPPIDRPLGYLVNLLRSVPTVITVVFIFLALPFAGVVLGKFESVLLAITFMQIVYFSEVFRGALAAVPRGQYDAAYALGMRTHVVLARIALPQAAVVAAPAFVSAVVLMVQNTSLAAAIALLDIIGAALIVQNITGEPSPVVFAGLAYLLLLVPLVRLARRWEQRVARAA
jgi:His/Glu/Gln/Arg/opine family amino acid ABC transporter permease subunit